MSQCLWYLNLLDDNFLSKPPLGGSRKNKIIRIRADPDHQHGNQSRKQKLSRFSWKAIFFFHLNILQNWSYSVTKKMFRSNFDARGSTVISRQIKLDVQYKKYISSYLTICSSATFNLSMALTRQGLKHHSQALT